jgi:hypothetical protein
MASLIYNKFLDYLASADISDDTFKVALVTSSYTPDKDTHEHFDDITNEVSGTGYTAGGNTVTGTLTLSTANDRLTLEFASTSWTSATITARGAVYYSSTGTASTSTLIAFNDFGSDVAVTAGTLALAASTVTLQN